MRVTPPVSCAYFLNGVLNLGSLFSAVSVNVPTKATKRRLVAVGQVQPLRYAAGALQPVVERGAGLDAAVVMLDDLRQRRKAAVVHEGPRQGDILQRRRLEDDGFTGI